MTIRGRLKETFGIADLPPEERKAYADLPGESWAEWARGPFAKTYLILGYFIGDSLVLVSGIRPVNDLVFVTLVVLFYLEFLLWQYLWYRPHPDEVSVRSGRFQPTFWRPAEFGRWTAEGIRRKAGLDPTGVRAGPDPEEFL